MHSVDLDYSQSMVVHSADFGYFQYVVVHESDLDYSQLMILSFDEILYNPTYMVKRIIVKYPKVSEISKNVNESVCSCHMWDSMTVSLRLSIFAFSLHILLHQQQHRTTMDTATKTHNVLKINIFKHCPLYEKGKSGDLHDYCDNL